MRENQALTEQAQDLWPLGPGRIEALTHGALDGFAARIKAAALAGGGALTPEDVDALAAEFKADRDGRLAQGFRQVWESCVSGNRWAVHERRREKPFSRVLVERFSHLLAPEGVEPDGDGGLSRRMISGFLHALDMMIGSDPLDAYQQRGRKIVARLQGQRDDDFSWRDVYQDAEAKWLADDVLMQIARHFQAMAKRRNWMIGVVDSHLRPMPATTGNGTTGQIAWRFGEAEFHEMMQALYADLRDRLDDEGGRCDLVDRYGEGNGEMLACLLRDLDQGAGETGSVTTAASGMN